MQGQKADPHPYSKLRERHLEQPLWRAIGQHPCTGQAVPLLCTKLTEHRARWQKAFIVANNSNPSVINRMTNTWLYEDPGTPGSNEKNKLDLYGLYSFSIFIEHLCVRQLLKNIYFWLCQFLVAASLVVARGLSCLWHRDYSSMTRN